MRSGSGWLVVVMVFSVAGGAWGKRGASAALVTAAAVPPSESEFTACQRYPPEKRFKLSLRGEVSVDDLVGLVGGIACQTIVVSPAVAGRAGKVSLEVPDLVSAAEVYRIFRSALDVLGLTIERSGAVWKVIDAGRAREISTLVGDGETPAGEPFVTRLLHVRHAAVSEVAEVLTKLRSHDGDLSIYAAGSSLIVTDHGSNVRRIEDLLRALDVEAAGERIWTLATHGQNATELAATIEKVLDATRHAPAADRGAARARGGVSLVPVDAAHLLVIVGDERVYRRVASLAERIDPAIADGGSSQVHVLYLAHTNAEDVVATLREIGFAQRTAQRGAPVGGGAGGGAQGELRISADKVSNAIVVLATGGDFLMVRDLVTKLDIPRRQVYVEAAILDLSTDQLRQVGVSWHGGDTSSGTTVVAADGSKSVSSLITDAASLASLFSSGGLTTGVFGQSFSYAGVTVPSFGVVLKALAQSKDVNVISQPHLLTLDNAKASLSVGQSIPFQTQSVGTVTGAATPTVMSTYQRQDVALKLELTPHVNEESIRLEIDGEISDVPDGQSAAAAGGPTTNKRTIKTSVVVGDGETIVLGGLEKEGESELVDKVPILGDLPILGWLFRSKSRQRSKRLRPSLHRR